MRNRQATQLLSELSHSGRRGAEFPASDVPEWPIEDLLPTEVLAVAPPALPELAEPDVVRHFVNLSTRINRCSGSRSFISRYGTFWSTSGSTR